MTHKGANMVERAAKNETAIRRVGEPREALVHLARTRFLFV